MINDGLGLKRRQSSRIEDWIFLCINDGNWEWIIYRLWSRVSREPEQGRCEEAVHGSGHYKSGPFENVGLGTT